MVGEIAVADRDDIDVFAVRDLWEIAPCHPSGAEAGVAELGGRRMSKEFRAGKLSALPRLLRAISARIGGIVAWGIRGFFGFGVRLRERLGTATLAGIIVEKSLICTVAGKGAADTTEDLDNDDEFLVLLKEG